ncbi:MAG: hypothetical protein BWY79_01916 [Actinobacteria bacterium ADurb.Bin444]|nr:MAG: hypothetical protein BWY79_01916 [Actinobacteria bacterium ADurb.Bin444]
MRLRPKRSASLAKGTSDAATAKRYTNDTQLSATAVREKLAWMAGMAMFTEEPRKGAANAPTVVTRRTLLRRESLMEHDSNS